MIHQKSLGCKWKMPRIRTQPSFQNPTHAGRARSGLARRSAARGATQPACLCGSSQLHSPGPPTQKLELPLCDSPDDQQLPKTPALVSWRQDTKCCSLTCLCHSWIRITPHLAGAAKPPGSSAAPIARGRMQFPGSSAERGKAGSSILLPECGPYCGTSQSPPGG